MYDPNVMPHPSRAEENGRDAAVWFAAYLDDATLRLAFDPPLLLERLTFAQEVILPESPWNDLEAEPHDDWCTGFWQQLEEIAQQREDYAGRRSVYDLESVVLELLREPGDTFELSQAIQYVRVADPEHELCPPVIEAGWYATEGQCAFCKEES